MEGGGTMGRRGEGRKIRKRDGIGRGFPTPGTVPSPRPPKEGDRAGGSLVAHESLRIRLVLASPRARASRLPRAPPALPFGHGVSMALPAATAESPGAPVEEGAGSGGA